jgi:polysaccharide pyruvyl transferase WcaK-like protein
MGVPAERILVGADWAWLFRPEIDSQWAWELLKKYGVEEGRVCLGVNLVNEIWRDNMGMKDAWAALLDRLIENHDAQVVFFCNESREGDYFDRAAAEAVQRTMRHESALLPNLYYTPSQMISLLSRMNLTISQRYHFTLFSVLADVYPISIRRGQKMRGLNEELSLPYVGDMLHVEEDIIIREVEDALKAPESKLLPLRLCRRQLEVRAENNLSLLRYSLVNEGVG